MASVLWLRLIIGEVGWQPAPTWLYSKHSSYLVGLLPIPKAAYDSWSAGRSSRLLEMELPGPPSHHPETLTL